MPVDSPSVGAVVTPFPDRLAPEPEAEAPVPAAFRLAESPFVSEYAEPEAPLGEEGEAPDAAGEAVEQLLEALHVDELDEAIAGLADELRGAVAAEPAFETEAEPAREALLRERVAPLLAAAQADLRRVAEALGRLDPRTATEAEYHEAIDAVPLPEVEGPTFEFFLDGLRKKLKSIVSGAASLAMRGLSPALGYIVKPLLARLEKLARPLLDKVITYALDKVPAPYQPLARTLAARLRGTLQGAAGALAARLPAGEAEAPIEPGEAPTPQEEAVPDTSRAQLELDLALAEVALGGERAEREAMGSAAEAPTPPARDPYADLAAARARFVREVTEASDDREVEVAIDHFLPAIMLAARGGIQLLGRNRVLDFLGKVIAPLLKPLVGKASAPVLGRVLADVGLRTFLHAEVEPGAALQAAGETVAAAVEETARRVAQLPDELLASPEAAAPWVREAFDGAVAATFPSNLVRPELRETEAPGAWVLLPLRRRGRYRKFSHVFDVTLSPATARAVRGRGASTVAGVLRDRLRLQPDAVVHARVHLYEAVPGTSLATISRSEEVRGLGSADPEVASQLQPLTPEAALLLLGAPGLGRELADELPGEADAPQPRVGERLYYLEVAGAPARPLGRESHFRVVVNLRREEIHLGLFLSEVVAQKIAAALRAKRPAAAVVAELRGLLAPMTAALKHAHTRGLVRIRGLSRRAVAAERRGPAARALRHAFRVQAGRLALRWAWAHLRQHLDQAAADFIARADGPEDGVRLSFSFRVPGLAQTAGIVRGIATTAPGWPPAAPVHTALTLHAGPRLG